MRLSSLERVGALLLKHLIRYLTRPFSESPLCILLLRRRRWVAGSLQLQLARIAHWLAQIISRSLLYGIFTPHRDGKVANRIQLSGVQMYVWHRRNSKEIVASSGLMQYAAASALAVMHRNFAYSPFHILRLWCRAQTRLRTGDRSQSRVFRIAYYN